MRSSKSNYSFNHSVTNFSDTCLNSELTDSSHVATKSYVDSLFRNDRNKRDLTSIFNNQDKEFQHTKLTISDSLHVTQIQY